jgi:hypothetical protein
MPLRDRLRGTFATLDQVLLGSLFTLRAANRKLHAAIASHTPDDYGTDIRLQHETSTLRTELAAAVQRIQRVEDKATKTVIGVGLAVTILGSATAILGGDGLLANHGAAVRALAASLLITGMLFLVRSSYLALRVYAVTPIYSPDLHDLAPIATEAEVRRTLIYCIDQNNRVGTVKTNLLSSSFDCLRNGLTIVAVIAVFLVLLSCSTPPTKV